MGQNLCKTGVDLPSCFEPSFRAQFLSLFWLPSLAF